MLLKRRGNRGIHFGQRNGALLRALHQAGDGALGMERHEAGQQFVEDQADGKLVGARIQFLAHRLLGRHVLHGADHHAGLGHAVALQGARQAEIHDDDAAGLVAHDVAGLQIAMDDAFGVRCLQSGADLQHDVDAFLRRELALAAEECVRKSSPSMNSMVMNFTPSASFRS